MSGIFVEYALTEEDAGYTASPLRKYWSRRGTLDFLPKEDYSGRRVEEFPTEEEALRFIGGQTKTYRIARDLITAEDQILIRAFLIQEIKPLVDRVEALEEAASRPTAEPEAPRRRSRKTATEE